MILFSRKVDYAILALYHLMIQDGRGVSARELANYYELSRPFVANILKRLCQEGFVESQRGINGGYRLARSPRDITLDELVATLEGPFSLISCAPEHAEERVECELVDCCPIRSPLRVVHGKIRSVLRQTTIEDLRGEQGRLVPLQLGAGSERASDGHAADLSG